VCGDCGASFRRRTERGNERLAQLMPQMAKNVGVTEQLKATDQMKWVGLVNTAKSQVEEIIFAELVYN